MDLFDGMVKETDLLWTAHAEMKESLDKTRKRLFGELQEIRDYMTQLHAQLERIDYTERHKNDTANTLRILER